MSIFSKCLLVSIGIAGLVCDLFWIFFRRSRIGIAMADEVLADHTLLTLLEESEMITVDSIHGIHGEMAASSNSGGSSSLSDGVIGQQRWIDDSIKAMDAKADTSESVLFLQRIVTGLLSDPMSSDSLVEKLIDGAAFIHNLDETIIAWASGATKAAENLGHPDSDTAQYRHSSPMVEGASLSNLSSANASPILKETTKRLTSFATKSYRSLLRLTPKTDLTASFRTVATLQDSFVLGELSDTNGCRAVLIFDDLPPLTDVSHNDTDTNMNTLNLSEV